MQKVISNNHSVLTLRCDCAFSS